MVLHPNSSTESARKISANGFSLIELLIVVGIILLIFAIAIPSFLHARMAANQAAAAANSRSISSANVTYSSTYGNGYAGALGTLGGPAGIVLATCNQAVLIDNTLSNNGAGNASSKSGYTYTYVPGNALQNTPPGCLPGVQSYTLEADPNIFQVSGMTKYFVDSSGVIRYTSDGTQPNITSPALQ